MSSHATDLYSVYAKSSSSSNYRTIRDKHLSILGDHGSIMEIGFKLN